MFLRMAIGFGLLGLVAACDVVPTSDTNTGAAPLVATTSGFSSAAQAQTGLCARGNQYGACD